MSGLKLLSTGSALPSQVVTNDDLARVVDTSHEWIASRTGICARRRCAPGESHTGLCLAAARQALERAGVGPEEVGVCLVATLTADQLSPAVACTLQRELGMGEDTVCFDLNAACSGFIYALHTAQCLLAAAPRKIGLILGAEVLSRVLDYTDRGTCILFGDGAGAAVVEWREGYPSLHAVLGCRGSQAIHIPGVAAGAPSYVHMEGQAVFRFAVETVPACITQVLDAAKLTVDDVDRFVFHQANQRIIDMAVRRLKLSPEKCTGNIASTGNTSAASVPILLDELVRSGGLRPGQRALCVGFGAGLTWGGALLEVGEPRSS